VSRRVRGDGVPTAPSDQPLTVAVKGGRLVISIGVKTLEHACLCSNQAWRLLGENNVTLDPRDHIKVTNVAGLAEDIMHAILEEAEDGSSPLTNLIDNAFLFAVEQGTEYVRFPDDDSDDDEP